MLLVLLLNEMPHRLSSTYDVKFYGMRNSIFFVTKWLPCDTWLTFCMLVRVGRTNSFLLLLPSIQEVSCKMSWVAARCRPSARSFFAWSVLRVASTNDFAFCSPFFHHCNSSFFVLSCHVCGRGWCPAKKHQRFFWSPGSCGINCKFFKRILDVYMSWWLLNLPD